MDDLASVIGAIAGAMVPLGAGVGFIWNKFEAGNRARELANETRFGDIEAKLQDCHDREVEHQERRGVQLTVIELLWQEVSRSNPDAWVIKRAKHLLDDLKGKAREG